MSLSFLGPLHPLIVHTPIVMLIFSAFFAVVGRLFDRDWLRKTSVLMLVFGFLGAFLAVRSGTIAHRVPEHQQGVPEKAIDEHGGGGVGVMYLSAGSSTASGSGRRPCSCSCSASSARSSRFGRARSRTACRSISRVCPKRRSTSTAAAACGSCTSRVARS